MGPAVVQKMIYEEGSPEGWEAKNVKRSYSGTISVISNVKYDLKFEVLLSDLGHDYEKLVDIKLNGVSLGECNPDCGHMSPIDCDYACIFYDCTPHLSQTTISSATGVVRAVLAYQGHSRDCDCDTNAWHCKRENIDLTLTPVVAAARITLTPIDE